MRRHTNPVLCHRTRYTSTVSTWRLSLTLSLCPPPSLSVRPPGARRRRRLWQVSQRERDGQAGPDGAGRGGGGGKRGGGRGENQADHRGEEPGEQLKRRSRVGEGDIWGNDRRCLGVEIQAARRRSQCAATLLEGKKRSWKWSVAPRSGRFLLHSLRSGRMMEFMSEPRWAGEEGSTHSAQCRQTPLWPRCPLA